MVVFVFENKHILFKTLSSCHSTWNTGTSISMVISDVCCWLKVLKQQNSKSPSHKTLSHIHSDITEKYHPSTIARFKLHKAMRLIGCLLRQWLFLRPRCLARTCQHHSRFHPCRQTLIDIVVWWDFMVVYWNLMIFNRGISLMCFLFHEYGS